MTEPQNKSELYKDLFLDLVYSMQTAALQNLGKLDNPLTNEPLVDLENAENYIDLLEMLRIKTENNLIDEEIEYLNTTLADVKTLYNKAKRK